MPALLLTQFNDGVQNGPTVEVDLAATTRATVRDALTFKRDAYIAAGWTISKVSQKQVEVTKTYPSGLTIRRVYEIV